MFEIGHVTYQSIPNFVPSSKMTRKRSLRSFEVKRGQKIENGRNRSCDLSFESEFCSDFKNDTENDRIGHLRSKKVNFV